MTGSRPTPAEHRPAARPPEGRRAPALLGRQTIFSVDGTPVAYELLFRSARPRPTAPDRWSAREQDAATRCVVETALTCGLTRLGGARPVFVNATRALLLGHLVPPMPRQLGVEVVESLAVDDALLDGVRRLRDRGHLVAVDDFVATRDQLRLLPHADLVKIDLRDLVRLGPRLVEQARSSGARTVVERVETRDQLERCAALGLDLVQGNLMEPTQVLEVGHGWSQPWDADATRSTARSTAKTGSRPAPLTSASA